MRLSGKPLSHAALVLLALALAGTWGWYYSRLSSRILWSVVHVSGDWQSGDAHLLEFPGDDHVVLIDTGFNRYTRHDLIPYLDEHGVDHIDQLVITHAHRNHYGGVRSLLEHLRRIDHVYFNLPPESRCDKESWATGCDYLHVTRTRNVIGASNALLHSVATGDVLYRDVERGITLKVVYVHDGVSPPVGETDINDTSALLLLRYGSTSVFFTADLNRKVSDYLVKQDLVPESNIVTAPHHGVEDAASNELLERIDAEIMIVSNSGRQWLGERGERMRHFADAHNIPTYVTGLHGDITVSLNRDGYTINTERSPDQR